MADDKLFPETWRGLVVCSFRIFSDFCHRFQEENHDKLAEGKEVYQMTVSNQQLLQRMNKEIEEAQMNHGDAGRVREHVRAVKLLCDLILEEEGTSARADSPQVTEKSSEPTAAEIRKMMGEEPSKSKNKKEDSSDEEANGSSIFDF